MRKLTTKLLFAIISAAFALVALGTTTFAWFTLSDSATVSQFNAQITAGEGIEISIDGTNYYTTIPTNIIQAKINKLKVTLKDITSPNGVDLYPLGVQNANTKIPFYATPVADQTNQFIQFDLWLRSPSATTVNLESVTFSSTAKSWTSDATFTHPKYETVTPEDAKIYYAHDALRLSISEGTTTKVVYEAPASDTNTVLNQTIIPEGMVNYYLEKNSINLLEKYQSVVLPASNDLLTPDTDGEDGENEIPDPVAVVSLAGNNVAKVITVRVWVEGWDPDCFNAILNEYINVQMVFKKA